MERVKLANSFILTLKRDGFCKAVFKMIGWLTYQIQEKLGIKHCDAIAKRRNEIADEINTILDSTVKYGPFKGLKLINDSWWGCSDRASMLLGLYEQEVLNSLINIPSDYRTFIDLGAADGYYGIGVLVNNLFDKSYCFEISEKGREIIKRNAETNGLSTRVVINGIADKCFYNHLSQDEIDRSVLLIDIEGGEFDLLDKKIMGVFMKSFIVIELHNWIDGASEKLQKLIVDAQETHFIEIFSTSARDLSMFDELKMYCDNDRWLVCSEGRPQLMSWMRLNPKNT